MREPRPAPVPDVEPGDAWNRAWGAPALQDLGRYLVATGSRVEQAALLVEQVWIFYSYALLPALKRHVPLVIAVDSLREPPRIQLTLLVTDELDDLPADNELARLRRDFRHRFSEPLSAIADLTMDLTQVPGPQGQRVPPSPRYLDLIRRQVLNTGDRDFVVVYIDDLVSELATVMDADEVPPWVDTPNLMFGGLAPRSLLGTPDAHLLRDVVTRAKFNLPAA